jgi:hypothetical protein
VIRGGPSALPTAQVPWLVWGHLMIEASYFLVGFVDPLSEQLLVLAVIRCATSPPSMDKFRGS